MGLIYSLLDSLAYFKVKLTTEFSQPPVKADNGSAGYDVFSVENCVIEAGKRKLVSIGISVEIPRHFYLRCAPRSGLSCKGIDIGAGVIDASYRGTIKVLMINNSTEEYIVCPGDKIAQLILERCSNVKPIVVSELSETERGEGGFGSTGNGSQQITHTPGTLTDFEKQILTNEIVVLDDEEPTSSPVVS